MQILTSCFKCWCKSPSRSLTSCIHVDVKFTKERRSKRNHKSLLPAACGFYTPRWSGNMFSEHQAEQMCNFPECSQELCKDTNNNPLQHRRARCMMMRSCPTGPSPPSKSQTKRLRRWKTCCVALSVFDSFARRHKQKKMFSLNLTWHEWDDKVIHTLHVRCSRISYGSYVEDSFDGPEITDDLRFIISWKFWWRIRSDSERKKDVALTFGNRRFCLGEIQVLRCAARRF